MKTVTHLFCDIWSEILCFLRNIELHEILYATIGAFLGFFLAYWAGKRIDRRKRMQSIENIKQELLSIKRFIDRNILDTLKNFSPHIASLMAHPNRDAINRLGESEKRTVDRIVLELAYTLYTPIWETVLYSGGILDFKDERYFNELIQVYTRINKLPGMAKIVIEVGKQDNLLHFLVIKQCIQLSEILDNNNGALSKLLYK